MRCVVAHGGTSVCSRCPRSSLVYSTPHCQQSLPTFRYEFGTFSTGNVGLTAAFKRRALLVPKFRIAIRTLDCLTQLRLSLIDNCEKTCVSAMESAELVLYQCSEIGVYVFSEKC